MPTNPESPEGGDPNQWDDVDDQVVALIREARRRERAWIRSRIRDIDPSEHSVGPDHYAQALHDVIVILNLRDKDQARPKARRIAH